MAYSIMFEYRKQIKSLARKIISTPIYRRIRLALSIELASSTLYHTSDTCGSTSRTSRIAYHLTVLGFAVQLFFNLQNVALAVDVAANFVVVTNDWFVAAGTARWPECACDFND